MRSAIANIMFDFIQSLERITSEEQAFAELNKVTAFFGMDSLAISFRNRMNASIPIS